MMKQLLNAGIALAVAGLSFTSVFAQNPIPIAEARQIELGEVVTVAGRVSAHEFSGAAFMQDGTGGIAIFDGNFKRDVQIGDSVIVTGPLSEFQPTPGEPGTGLLQITGGGTTFQIVDVPRVPPTPLNVSANAIGENIEGVLVRVRNVSFTQTGAFQGDANYNVVNPDGVAIQVRIDRNVREIVGQQIPQDRFNLVGTISQFRGTYQILPRTPEEVGIAFEEDKWRTQTDRSQLLEVATWNIEWFGDTTRGPRDDQRQFENVSRVIDSLNADLWGFQEIADEETNAFGLLGESHPRYGYMRADDLIGQSQKTGFFFKRSVIDSVSIGYFIDQRQGSWGSGRYPFRFRGVVKTNGGNHTVDFFVLHARATTAPDPNAANPDTNNRHRYIQRRDDAISFHTWLGNNFSNQPIVVLGDFNDDVVRSTYRDTVSPYQVFVDDPEWFITTKQLSERGLGSYFFQGQPSMIDHIMVNQPFLGRTVSREDFTPNWGNSYVYNPFYLTSYSTTTSDHFPVHARFIMDSETSVEEQHAISGTRAYPTPAREVSTIEFEHKGGDVKVEIFNAVGTPIALLVNQPLPGGLHTTVWNTGGMPSGMYYARITSGSAITTLPIPVMK